MKCSICKGLLASLIAVLACGQLVSLSFGQETSEAKAAKETNRSNESKQDKPVKTTVFQGKVTEVIDGDSIVVVSEDDTKFEVQLEGIDAPEKKQPFGKESTDALKKLVLDKAIRVSWDQKDNYGRLLGQVYLDELHCNSEMLRLGLAWHFKRYNKSEALAKLETEAREAKRGLWKDDKPQAPWDYRKENKAPDRPDTKSE